VSYKKKKSILILLKTSCGAQRFEHTYFITEEYYIRHRVHYNIHVHIVYYFGNSWYVYIHRLHSEERRGGKKKMTSYVFFTPKTSESSYHTDNTRERMKT
jgi:hypothetical protein